ncbi:MAG: PTS fructose transporter subunit IIC, partial [Cardiobacteriales bacterium]
MKLKKELITLNANPTDKTQAMKDIVQLFVDADCTTADYLSGMLAREVQENTYLGNGVAIPHGTPEVRDCIKQTAIAVMQIPQGLEWGEDGELVHLAIGIAANS